MKKYTVVGRYPNGKAVIVQCYGRSPFDAHQDAIGKIFRDGCGGKIPDDDDGRLTTKETLKQIDADLDIVAVLEGHTQSAFMAHIEHLRPCISHLVGGKDEIVLTSGYVV